MPVPTSATQFVDDVSAPASPGRCGSPLYERGSSTLEVRTSTAAVSAGGRQRAVSPLEDPGGRGTLLPVDPSVSDTTPTAEKPALSDAERAERLKLLAERLRDPEGLDHDALAQVEQLSEDGK